MPLTTYSESEANTILENPPPAQYRRVREANTARSSARLLVCGCPSCSGRLEIVNAIQEVRTRRHSQLTRLVNRCQERYHRQT